MLIGIIARIKIKGNQHYKFSAEPTMIILALINLRLYSVLGCFSCQPPLLLVTRKYRRVTLFSIALDTKYHIYRLVILVHQTGVTTSAIEKVSAVDQPIVLNFRLSKPAIRQENRPRAQSGQ